jgi:2-oxo-4-hydroxy-4-carboxy-5-ureidoimidazoline decarboxylase
MQLNELNAASDERAVELFAQCCGSSRWSRSMAARRPFRSVGGLLEAADVVFDSLAPSDWLEAFATHPRIGERLESAAGASAAWSAAEQSGVTDASRGAFERRNQDYEERFGHTFIVCASGRSGDEMLKLLEQRMLNNPDDELRQAAGEQTRITRLRLTRLLT